MNTSDHNCSRTECPDCRLRDGKLQHTPNTTAAEEWEKEFELDAMAHAQGRCSYSLLAICSAEEQRVKLFIRKTRLEAIAGERLRFIEILEGLERKEGGVLDGAIEFIKYKLNTPTPDTSPNQ
jgi:hypothetical protein